MDDEAKKPVRAAKAKPKAQTMDDEAHGPHRVTSPYAYYDDDGVMKAWAEGQVLTDADEIADLKERGAPIEKMPDEEAEA